MKLPTWFGVFALLASTSFAGPTISLDDPVPGWASRPGHGLSGTTGGKGGTTVTVSTMADLTKHATSSSPMIILVEPGTYTGTLAPTSNKTIVGKAPGVLLKGNIAISGSTKSNIVIRNLAVRLPVCNSYDECKAGDDAVAVENDAHHVWLDHLDVADGQDGNCDFTKGSDYITASWMKFHYTYAKEHRFSNLIASSDDETGSRGKLQITYMNSWWGDRVNQRQPRGRFGKVHLLNNLWGSKDGGQIVAGPGVEASYVIENNFYDVPAGTQAVKIYDASATVRSTGNSGTASGMNVNVGTAFTVPYAYTKLASTQVKSALTATVGGAGNTVTLGSVVVPPQNDAPTVTMTAPALNASFDLGSSATFSATAKDSDGTVSKVVFIARAAGTTTLIPACSDATAPYSCTWAAPKATTYNVYAVAIDNDGDSAESNDANITFRTVAVNKAPRVAMTSPTTNSAFDLGSPATFTATASDSDGTVSKVVFIARAANTTALISACSDATAPYSCAWTAPTATTYNVYAVAIDNDGDSAESNDANITFRVPVVNKLPKVALLTPAANATYDLGDTAKFSASATDTDGTVEKVVFIARAANTTTLISACSDVTAPFACNWKPGTATTYNVYAVAIDNDGDSTKSAAVNITFRTPTSVGRASPSAGAGTPSVMGASEWASLRASGTLRLWSLDGEAIRPSETMPGAGRYLVRFQGRDGSSWQGVVLTLP